MPVVINEFEVVAEPQPAEGSSAEATSTSPAPTPYEIERIVERQQERWIRLWAH